MNALQRLSKAGQGVWLDFLRRGLVTGGGLERLAREDSLAGVTSNPTIFGRALSGSPDYEEAIRRLTEEGIRDPQEMWYELALADTQMACEVLRPVYDATEGRDGFVSFELDPRIARDTEASIASARELWRRIDQPNAMLKVPGTNEGVPAIEALIADGININITLLFSVAAYERVARAYVAGLQKRRAAGQDVSRVASVASFFVSRVDTKVDDRLPSGSPLRGAVAVANAKVAYATFKDVFSGAEWERLAEAGARVQRPLWASTGTKNPDYSDVKYVEELIGPDTVNTMPQQTLDAFRDHGVVRKTLTKGITDARAALKTLKNEGIDLSAVTDELLDEGIESFTKDLDKVLETIGAKIQLARRQTGARPGASLGRVAARVEKRIDQMERKNVVSRIWRKDHKVWKKDSTEITDRLGWLGIAELMHEKIAELEGFAKQAAADGLTHAVLLGMGGSSLAPDVLRKTFGVAPGFLDLRVLDSTHPSTIARVESGLDLRKTLFVVASKSGTTLETMSHLQYFYARIQRGNQFVAITDAGTPLEHLARSHDFRATFVNPSDIGGRYSALSLFGLVPAALIGVDLHGLLDAGEEMACASDAYVPLAQNPGAWLGVVLGEAARAKRDKLTLVLPASIESFGSWVEQLIAESTGKEGKGIVPVVGEPLGKPKSYSSDRIFVSLGDHGGLEALEKRGHPVVRLATGGAASLGAEFFRWEFATAVAGHVLGINPFDQPNVAEAKEMTAKLLESGTSDPGYDDAGEVLSSIKKGDYVAIQAFIDASPENERALQAARIAIRDRYRVATTVGFGPRYLHSTGQLHKGGPDGGVFIQVVDGARADDIAIPGRPFTFGTLLHAQAQGDLESLRSRGRRIARVTRDQLLTSITGGEANETAHE